MTRKWMLAVLFTWLASPAAANAQGNAVRGELLYATHCIACHSAEIHWRDKKLATDWPSLQAQVRRWQEVAGLGWHDEDITLVARYLNALHYHYPERARKSGPASNPSHVPGTSRTAPSIPDRPFR